MRDLTPARLAGLVLAGATAAAAFLRGCAAGTPRGSVPVSPPKTAGPSTNPVSPTADPAAACWKTPGTPFTREELLARTKCQPPFGIRVDTFDYTPSVATTPGLAMTPRVPRIAPKGLKFHWQTNFGFFARRTGPGTKAEPLGADVLNKGEEVWWTYDPALGRAAKPEVHITLSAISSTGKTLATAGQLLTWEWDMAVVKR